MYAEGASPLTQEQLQNQKYRDLLSIRLYYDWHTWVIPLETRQLSDRYIFLGMN